MSCRGISERIIGTSRRSLSLKTFSVVLRFSPFVSRTTRFHIRRVPIILFQSGPFFLGFACFVTLWRHLSERHRSALCMFAVCDGLRSSFALGGLLCSALCRFAVCGGLRFSFARGWLCSVLCRFAVRGGLRSLFALGGLLCSLFCIFAVCGDRAPRKM